MDKIDQKKPAPTLMTPLVQCLLGHEETFDQKVSSSLLDSAVCILRDNHPIKKDKADFTQRDTAENSQIVANVQAIGCTAAPSDLIGAKLQPLLGQFARSGSAMILSSLGAGNPSITMTSTAKVIMGLITTDFAELVDPRGFQVVVDPCFYLRLSRLSEREWELLARQLPDRALNSWKMNVSVSSQSLRDLLSEFEEIARQLSEDPPSRTVSPAPSPRTTRSASPPPQSTLHPTPPANTTEYRLERLCTMAGYKELSTDSCGCVSISCTDFVLQAVLIDSPSGSPLIRYGNLMSTDADGVWFNLESGECVIGTSHIQNDVVLDRARILFEDPKVLQFIEMEFCVIFEAMLWDEEMLDMPPTRAHQRRTFWSSQETIAEIGRALAATKDVKLVYASAKPKLGETEDHFRSRLTTEAENRGWTYGWYSKAQEDIQRCFIYL